MADESSKWQYLKHASKLVNDTKLCNVCLSPDLTPKQKGSKQKKLYVELKGCREKGEKDGN